MSSKQRLILVYLQRAELLLGSAPPTSNEKLHVSRYFGSCMCCSLLLFSLPPSVSYFIHPPFVLFTPALISHLICL